MKIGVKYCGGCNPCYERSDIIRWVKRDYPTIEIEAIKEDAFYDICLIICGCREECSDYSYLKKQYDVLVIRSPEEYENASAHIKEKLRVKKG